MKKAINRAQELIRFDEGGKVNNKTEVLETLEREYPGVYAYTIYNYMLQAATLKRKTLGIKMTKMGPAAKENTRRRVDLRLPISKIEWLQEQGGVTQVIERLIDEAMGV